MQLEDTLSHPIASYMGEEGYPHLSITSVQVAVESCTVFPEPPLLQIKQIQFPQMLLIRLVLQALHSFVALLWTYSRVSGSLL